MENRIIKFRGKNIHTGEWLYGDYHREGKTHYITKPADFLREYAPIESIVDEKTVGQFTELCDKNGEEIYEGDIITVKGRYPRVVLWDKMMWALMPTEYYHDEVFWVMNLQHPGVDWWEEFADEFEIIGNRFDNPSLISDKQ